jgi:type II secretory pathway pseudopilin PulG
MMSPLQGIVVAVIVLVAIVIMVVIAAENGRRQRARLRRQFGPEYERAIEQYGSIGRAEKALSARARRLQKFHLRNLNDADRVHFGNAWTGVQTKFVDDPSAAVHEANRLIKTVMQARGYPVEDFEHRVADLSVDHAHVVQHYRAARALAQANQEGRANTEELRQAFVHYRALFTELLSEADVEPVTLRHARA